MPDQTCTKCGNTSPHTDEFFYRTGGGRYLKRSCKRCYPGGAERRRSRRAAGNPVEESKEQNNRRVRQLKVELGCSRCGFNEHYAALDFHHVNPADKTLEVSRMLRGSYGWDRIKAEIDKCVVLCANCHRSIETERQAQDK